MMRGAVGGAAITSGVGERPLGLSGAAPPRPIKPMPSDAVGASARFGVEDADADRSSTVADRKESRSKVATVGLAALAVAVALVVVAGVMSAVSPDGVTTTATSTTTDLPRPLSDPPKVPTDVETGPAQGGIKTVTWKHEGKPGDTYSFVVRDNHEEPVNEAKPEQTPDGWTAQVPDSVKCVSVQAVLVGSAASDWSPCE